MARGQGEHGSVRKQERFHTAETDTKMGREGKSEDEEQREPDEKCFHARQGSRLYPENKNAAKKDYSGCTFGMGCKGKCGGSKTGFMN